MLAILGATTLVLVAGSPLMLPTAPGGINLNPPQNVQVYLIDDSFTLMWNRSDESDTNMTFSAEYQIPKLDNWIKLPGCQYIAGTKCDFSSVKLNVYDKLKLRLRAEKGNNTSLWHEVGSFVPFLKAHIGPPGIHLEAEDKAIIIHISRPGKKDSVMWAQDNFAFTYDIVLWRKSSGEEKRIETIHRRDKIFKLSPETTYCVKVKAKLLVPLKQGAYGGAHCINTTVEHPLPAPENVEMDMKRDSYVLKWDYANANVTFRAQWLNDFSKWNPGNYSDDWKLIPSCESVKSRHCIFPQSNFSEGTYFFRVQASNGNNTSFWSEEKEVDTSVYNLLPSPVITVKSISDSLRVSVGFLEDSDFLEDSLIYEVIFWENTSNIEEKIMQKSPEFTIVNLQLRTVYCVKARVHKDSPGHQSSEFSDPVCKKTESRNSSTIWIIAGIFAVLVFILIIIYAVKSLLRCFNYTFFPSLKPFSNIDEYFSEPPLKNLLLLTSEEQTESCFVIENTDVIVIVEEMSQSEGDHKKYNSQTSQDSGNYSIEDENMESRTNEELLRKETDSE
ncbi:interferon alpha/beta receptor 1 isoform X1 [Castor canadensis]|uniref:Interferon alpha/beta receptor 1 isoform X1 n=3 Tax=Castor canadensis TaxID=51338 RepID=A0AC58MHJ8_CASCN